MRIKYKDRDDAAEHGMARIKERKEDKLVHAALLAEALQEIDSVTLCPYCGDHNPRGLSCCGEAHFEEHYYCDERSEFFNHVTGEWQSDFDLNTMVKQ